uniref:tRNA carboxymethyluridine synthase n=1 Tax=viral metagenome TaxID=1070528 RepID=A0A6C0KWY1_9ZZZZ|tara:strand:- start:10490 stop:12409 length:1920 start_codon:yes stop_codon:yes gene_type:complete
MCQSSNKSVEELEDLFKHDEMNTITNIDEINIEQYMNTLSTLVREHISKETETENVRLIVSKLKKKFPNYLQKCTNKHQCQYKKTTLLFYFKKFVLLKKLKEDKYLELMLMKSPSRDISGINQITILTSPHPDNQNFSCKHDCYYCPNEPAHEGNNWTAQPRSYLYSEPAVLRANRNKFEPDLQTFDRLKSLLICGHKCDKLEFILEGGTFTEYPKPYLYRYFRDFIYTCNNFFEIIKFGFDSPELVQRKTLEKEISINQNTRCKIIGICIETRPDAILLNDEDGIPWIKTLLNWGVTRLQLGVQHIDNQILKKINRGHNIEKVIEAIEICKNNCFKIDIHIMPDLPGSDPEKDKAMFDELYSSDKYQPDQMKVYPCEVVPWTVIEKWHKSGKYKPYGEDKNVIQDVISYSMKMCPPWVRLPRVMRDIPDHYISGGLKCGNMRQNIEGEKGFVGRDIRSREIGRHPKYMLKDAKLFIRKYKASNGTEYFISFESKDNIALFGFCRLRIIHQKRNIHSVYDSTLYNMGLIRELHVYGSLVGVNQLMNTNMQAIQHNGIGKKLIHKAEQISFINHFKRGVVVISGIGVRGYYEKQGYFLRDNYMNKRFKYYNACLILVGILFGIIYDIIVTLITIYFTKKW